MDCGNFKLELADADFQDLLDFDPDFNDFVASSSMLDYADFLHEIGMTEYENLPPPETPAALSTSDEEPKKKRFRCVTEENLKMYEGMNQSEATKKNTKWGMKIFQEWHNERFGEEMDTANIPIDQLADKLGQFYCEARPQDTKNNEPEYYKNTLKNIRGAINRHLSDINRDTDIVNDRAFKSANNKLNGLLKQRMSTGNSKPTQHKQIINNSDLQKISTYLESAYNDPIKLRLCVWYNISMHFISRGLELHHQLKLNSFEFKVDENDREYVSLNHETLQKNYQGGLTSKEDIADKRMYANPDSPSCPVRMLKFFISKTDGQATSLFNQILKDALHLPASCEIWYTDKSLGKHTFRNFLPDICKQAGCPRRYTAHCLRATAIQSMSNAGFETREIMFMSGHRNESSVRSYSRDFTTIQKQSMSDVLAATASGNKCTTVDIPSAKITEGDDLVTTPTNINSLQHDVRNTMAAIQSGILSNSTFNNCTLNLNMKM